MSLRATYQYSRQKRNSSPGTRLSRGRFGRDVPDVGVKNGGAEQRARFLQALLETRRSDPQPQTRVAESTGRRGRDRGPTRRSRLVRGG